MSAPTDPPPPVTISVDGRSVDLGQPDNRLTLLEVLREQCSSTSVKDGCSPQGQCGCCTVLVDGQPRVACVTPVRRIAGRTVTTLDGLDAGIRNRWLSAFTACGASQCGFCTPGIILRLEGLRTRSPGANASEAGDEQSGVVPPTDEGAVERALAAHLCRCTGWRPILEAWHLATRHSDDAQMALANAGMGERDRAAAEARALLEGGVPQQVGSHVAAGQAGFAADTAPVEALVALPASTGRAGQTAPRWVVANTTAEARQLGAKVQGRRTTIAADPPLDAPPGDPGDWAVVLRTSWVDPAYLETDASWCEPGGSPADPLANGGAFGGKADSPVAEAARRLADEHQQSVRVLFDREDAVRFGPKRPPMAIAVRGDGTGIARVAIAADTAANIAADIARTIGGVAPGLEVERVALPGPPTSLALRGAVWIEAAVALAAATGATSITSPAGATAAADIAPDGAIAVRVACGDPLDEVVLRSYCTGAAHLAASWVTSEALAVDPVDGTVGDLTIRSMGVLRAADTPPITVRVDPSLGDTTGTPVPAGDAVVAAVALAVWRHQGLPPVWPTRQPLRSR